MVLRQISVQTSIIQQPTLIIKIIYMQARQLPNIDLSSLHYQCQSQLCSPRLKQRRSQISNLTPLVLQKSYFLSQFQYMHLAEILQKDYSIRTHNQNWYINQFIKKNAGLKQLCQINGRQFCKGIMRTAIIEQYEQNQIVQQKGSQADTVYIILEGKVGSIKNENETDMIAHVSMRQTYEILTHLARKQAKKINRLARKFSSFRELEFNYHQKYDLNGEEQFLQDFEKGHIFGDKISCLQTNYTHTFITLEKCLLLSFDIKNVMFWLNHAFQRKLQKLFKLLKKHPFFSALENETLQEVISYMSVHKRKKNQLVYQQGEQSTRIYFLQEGQLKIEKECNLFVDNPNELYIDRRKLMNKNQIVNQEFLAYANLQHLYNYRPINKVIQLGILTPFSLFGEQQIIENKRRQTSIKVSSLEAIYYRIDLNRIYSILGEGISVFLDVVKASIKQKIKYRQEIYAKAMHIQNKNNLKYFYYEGEKALPTPRKFKIQKINQKICQNSSSIVKDKIQDNIDAQSQSNYDIGEVNPQVKIKIQGFQKSYQHSIPPLYNTFNFHKMMRTKLIKQSISKLSLEQQEEEQSGPNKDFKFKNKEQLKKQHKIIDDSHTWRLVKQKVKQQHKLCKRKGSLKHNINFLSPLIDNHYFDQIESQIKKIQRSQKSGKFNVSTPRKRAQSLNAIMIYK